MPAEAFVQGRPATDKGILVEMDGAIVIDKPSGLTSHDVVASLRRALAVPRVGHAGTLDPLATGVLPVLLGRATRLAQFISGADKTYEAEVSLAFATDTDDSTGRPITAAYDQHLSSIEVERGLESLRGSHLQHPPAYSAKKVGGRRAYALARESRSAPLKPVTVSVRRLDLLAWNDPVATLHVVCSAGCYVRALARDLGRTLGSGGHLTRLRRLASGQFRLDDAVALDVVLRDPQGTLAHVITPSAVVGHLPMVSITGPSLDRALHGAEIHADALVGTAADGPDATFVRIVDSEGALVAVGRRGERAGSLHPVVVLM
jgi:tRNA pseudouridine55 synthase